MNSNYSTCISGNVSPPMFQGGTVLKVYLCVVNKKTWAYTHADFALPTYTFDHLFILG
jgi:hypothetical protein